MWFWICIHCHFAESIETGRVDNPGKPLRVKSLPNAKVSHRDRERQLAADQPSDQP